MKIAPAFALFAVLAGRVIAAEPVHLEPVSAFDRDDYIQIVYQRLVGKQESSLWMIGLPSFVPEYTVVIRNKRDAVDPKRYQSYVEVARAEKPISGWEEDKDGASLVKYDEKVAIQRTSKQIAASDVDILASAAFEVLKKTRFAEYPSQGLDGETFIFCFDRLAGRIWCPSGGEPALLQKAWSALAAFVRAEDLKSEEAALSDFRRACAGIQNPEANQNLRPTAQDKLVGK